MKKHTYFDLQNFENYEIESIINSIVIDREMLRQWPLSCVEKITSQDGRKWILKSNHHPCDIEGHFYTMVDHPNIIKPVHIHNTFPYQSILYQFQDAIPYSVINLNKKRETLERYHELHRIVDAIGTFQLPAYLKIDSEDAYHRTFTLMLDTLFQLNGAGKFNKVDSIQLETLSRMATDENTQELELTNIGYTHGDFSVDNILFSTETNELIILDWQRPIYGSPLIDEYAFLKSKNFDPDPPAKLIGALFQIYWLTDCAKNWFPAGIKTYDGQIKSLIEEMAEAYGVIKTNQMRI